MPHFGFMYYKYHNYCIKTLFNLTMEQHEVMTDKFLPRKPNEAKSGTI